MDASSTEDSHRVSSSWRAIADQPLRTASQGPVPADHNSNSTHAGVSSRPQSNGPEGGLYRAGQWPALAIRLHRPIGRPALGAPAKRLKWVAVAQNPLPSSMVCAMRGEGRVRGVVLTGL